MNLAEKIKELDIQIDLDLQIMNSTIIHSYKKDTLTFSEYCIKRIFEIHNKINERDILLNKLNNMTNKLGKILRFIYSKISDGKECNIYMISKELKKYLSPLVTLKSRLTTNGVLLSMKNCKLLIDESNLTDVQITLDGTEEEYCKHKGANKTDYFKVIK